LPNHPDIGTSINNFSRTLPAHESDLAKESIRNPYTLNFLNLNPSFKERDLEKALVKQLSEFLLELGKGFAFVERQQHIKTETSNFYLDLVFYNFRMKSFVLIELKTNKLTHQDIGQLQMYVNYYDRFEKQDYENSTIGILLCADKNDAVVKISLPEKNSNIIASKYSLYLPSEKQLIEELKKEIEKLNNENA
jgi:predicted nuclease of restriction endonuclease-like (RecB) superfamily